MTELNKYINDIKQVCEKYHVDHLYVFGSILTPTMFNHNSDVDLIVSININDPIDYAENYFALKSELEKIFNRKVDLLEEKAIKNPYFKEQIDKTKMLLYGN